MAWILGLTGGIGSGKSTASAWFSLAGYPVVDADAISRSLTYPGGAAIPAIANEFGADFITPEGTMNRAKMRELVFDDPKARERLEGVMRPLIRRASLEALERARSLADAAGKAFAVFDCPLLCEWPEARTVVDRLLVIDLCEEEQIQRVALRSSLTPERVRSIIRAQIPRQARLAQADDIIYNGGSLEDFRSALAALLERYLARAD